LLKLRSVTERGAGITSLCKASSGTGVAKYRLIASARIACVDR
jgi:hypothetical protein